MTNLVLQSFGRENEYLRAILTVLSYYSYTSLPLSQTRVLLFTDHPDYFAPFFDQLPVDYILLTPEKIKEMRGGIDFLHRMKIALIDEAFDRAQGNILYADSDTFFIADPTPLMDKLSEDQCFMHLWEYRFEELRDQPLPAGKTFQDFLTLIENKNFWLADGRQIKVDPQNVSWNAGVMFFHHSHVRFIADVYSLTDQFYPPTLNHASEQYAFSVVLQNSIKVQSCEKVIYHYWYRIKKQIVDDYLKKKLSIAWKEKPILEKLNDIKRWTQVLPKYFDHHVLTYQDHAIQAFNNNEFWDGYQWTFKSLMKDPFKAKRFLKDVFYHTRRYLSLHS
jgi:hypothetical protein